MSKKSKSKNQPYEKDGYVMADNPSVRLHFATAIKGGFRITETATNLHVDILGDEYHVLQVMEFYFSVMEASMSPAMTEAPSIMRFIAKFHQKGGTVPAKLPVLDPVKYADFNAWSEDMDDLTLH